MYIVVPFACVAYVVLIIVTIYNADANGTTYYVEIKNSCHAVINISFPSSSADCIESSSRRSDFSAGTESIEVLVWKSDGVENDYDVVAEKPTIANDDYVQMDFPINDVESAINNGLVRFGRAVVANNCSDEHRSVARRVATTQHHRRDSQSQQPEYESTRL